jgi:hypothetical protein
LDDITPPLATGPAEKGDISLSARRRFSIPGGMQILFGGGVFSDGSNIAAPGLIVTDPPGLTRELVFSSWRTN